MVYRPEPAHAHGRRSRVAVVLCNLGTPEAPRPAEVRRYLAQFLSDPRVVELPRALWLTLLHGVILRTRPARSAAKYASIWQKEGSPLLTWTRRQAQLLQGWMGHQGHDVIVTHAMRYGQPALDGVLDHLKTEGVERVLILPAYPQYAASTTASLLDALGSWVQQTRWVPELRTVTAYHSHPAYIAALARQVQAHWEREGQGELLLLSFHGVPARSLALGDPYHCQCQVTARLLREALGLPAERVIVSFQSRFGRARWLEPYTQATVEGLPAKGVKSIDVMCPGFTADCLETLEEIDMEVRQAFLQAGGQRYAYIPCLNDAPHWIEALGQIGLQHLQGWPTALPSPQEAQLAEQVRAESAARARAMGAPQ